jgi:hypothetical protein
MDSIRNLSAVQWSMLPPPASLQQHHRPGHRYRRPDRRIPRGDLGISTGCEPGSVSPPSLVGSVRWTRPCRSPIALDRQDRCPPHPGSNLTVHPNRVGMPAHSFRAAAGRAWCGTTRMHDSYVVPDAPGRSLWPRGDGEMAGSGQRRPRRAHRIPGGNRITGGRTDPGGHEPRWSRRGASVAGKAPKQPFARGKLNVIIHNLLGYRDGRRVGQGPQA